MINNLEFCSAISQKHQYTCLSKYKIVSDQRISHEFKLFDVLFILCNVYHMQWCVIYFV